MWQEAKKENSRHRQLCAIVPKPRKAQSRSFSLSIRPLSWLLHLSFPFLSFPAFQSKNNDAAR
jgi:hypothetical protein